MNFPLHQTQNITVNWTIYFMIFPVWSCKTHWFETKKLSRTPSAQFSRGRQPDFRSCGFTGTYLLHPTFFILVCYILRFTSFTFHPRGFICVFPSLISQHFHSILKFLILVHLNLCNFIIVNSYFTFRTFNFNQSI